MGKTATLNLRVDPEVKQEAEAVLRNLGLPMATAIDMYLRQIALTGGIPFSVTLPGNSAAALRTAVPEPYDYQKADENSSDANEPDLLTNYQ